MKFLCYLSFLFISTFSFAQEQSDKEASWQLASPEKEDVMGMRVESAYADLLANRKPVPVTVAVIDSGVDISHEDLKDVLWTNPKEIPNNGIDDDKNGYIDDVYGWNFIGGKDGDVSDDTSELTREYARISKKFDDIDTTRLSKKQKQEYAYYKTIKTDFENDRIKNSGQYEMYSQIYKNTTIGIDSVKHQLNKDSLSLADIQNIDSAVPEVNFLKMVVTKLVNHDMNSPLSTVVEKLKEAQNHFKKALEIGSNVNFNPRGIVGDNYAKMNERRYGNNHVKSPTSLHGTHVAGIIAANRANALGMKGVSNAARIMTVRVVPNGDERDKDVANGIRYAVDNGAKIINISFGKSYSPQKFLVDKAVQYAEKKGVLLIHAAGNDGQDNDTHNNFPSPRFEKSGKTAKLWIEVGASSATKKELAASFSNYGAQTVTLFAPGVHIYSTLPENKYGYNDGTSMACPSVSGVAALLASYFPSLSMAEIRQIIIDSVRKVDDQVPTPGSGDLVSFKRICMTGGVIDAYQAVLLALEKIK